MWKLFAVLCLLVDSFNRAPCTCSDCGLSECSTGECTCNNTGYGKLPKVLMSEVRDLYPNLSGHRSLLAKHLSWDLYTRLLSARTTSGYTLDKVIQNGVENPDFEVGILAGDEDSYTDFAELFNPVISDYHGYYHDEGKHVSDFDPKKIVCADEIDPKYVISSRIRISCNIRGFCLSPHINKTERQQVESIVSSALSSITGEFAGQYDDLPSMSPELRQQLEDEHVLFGSSMSRHFLSGGMARDSPDGRGVWYNEEKDFHVWVNEEDHLRIISMEKGGNIKRVFYRLLNGLEAVTECIRSTHHEFMRDKRLGFIQSCPTNLGTGLRCSFHVRLPLLSAHPMFDTIGQVLRLQIRGTNGKFTEPVAGVYDISNRDRLGSTEVQQVQLVIDGVSKLIEMEKRLERGGNIGDILNSNIIQT